MTLTTSTITGRVPLPNDATPTSAEVVFTLSAWDAEGGDVIPPASIRAPLTATADLPDGFELWRNTEGLRGSHYIVTAYWKEAQRAGTVDRQVSLGVMQVGDDAEYALADLLAAGVDPATPSYWMSISEAQYADVISAVQSAEDAAALSEAARDAAIAAAQAGKSYATKASGATGEGEEGYFWSPEGAAAGFQKLYTVTGGLAVAVPGIEEMPMKGAIDAKAAAVDLVTAARRIDALDQAFVPGAGIGGALPKLNLSPSDALAGRLSIGGGRVMGNADFNQIGSTVADQLGLPATQLRRTGRHIAFGAQTGSPVSDVNDAAGYTYHQMMVLETPFDQVQLLFENNLTTGDQTIGPVKICTIASLDVGYANDEDWTPVTFGAATTVTVPNASVAGDPQYVLSDPITLTSAERTDFPARSILLVRTYIPAATSPQSLQAETSTDIAPLWPNDLSGRVWASWRATGDGVTDPTTFSATPTKKNRWPCVAARVRSTHAAGRAATVVNPGDSLHQGPLGGTTAHVWQGVKAATLPTLPLGFVNMAWNGQNSTAYLARAVRLFPILLPEIAFYVAYSPNDALNPTQATADTAIVNLEAFLGLCRRTLTLPILGTAVPRDSYTEAEDMIRQQVNAYVRELGGRYMVVDYDALITDGQIPANINPDLAQGDGLHVTPIGDRIMAAPDAAALKRIMATQFQRFLPTGSGDPFEAIYGGMGGYDIGMSTTAAPFFVPVYGGDAAENTGVSQ